MFDQTSNKLSPHNAFCILLLQFCSDITQMTIPCVTIEMKATEQYFHVVLFIMLYKVVLTFKYVDEILACDHSNESYRAVISCGADSNPLHSTAVTFVSADETLVSSVIH